MWQSNHDKVPVYPGSELVGFKQIQFKIER